MAIEWGRVLRGSYFPKGKLLQGGPACEKLLCLVPSHIFYRETLTSRTLPTRIFCSELSWTPGAVLISVFSIPRSFVGPPAVCWPRLCNLAVSEGIPVDMLREKRYIGAALTGVTTQALIDERDIRAEVRIKLL